MSRSNPKIHVVHLDNFLVVIYGRIPTRKTQEKELKHISIRE